MGGLFNSPNTMLLLENLNGAFQKKAFTQAANNQGLIDDLTNLASKDIADKYGLNTGIDSYDHQLWYQWLDIFDKNGGDKVLAAMANALSHAKTPDINQHIFSGIEFFAVPAKGKTMTVHDTSVLQDQEQNGKWTLIVTVETPTYDVIFSHLRSIVRKKSAKKGGRRKKTAKK